MEPADITAVPVTSQEPPLSSPPPTPFSHSSTLALLQGTSQTSLGPLLSCRQAGQLLQLARRTGTACRGRRQQNFSGMWDRWKDKHPWNTRRLETSVYACMYTSMWSKLPRVYIYVDHLHGPSCGNVCVSMLFIRVQ